MTKIFNTQEFTFEQAVQQLKDTLNPIVPFVSIQPGALGGKDNLMVLISFEPKEQWSNGYVENSNYFRLHIYSTGEVEQFVRSLYQKGKGISYETRVHDKFRKVTAKSFDIVCTKIKEYCLKIKPQL